MMVNGVRLQPDLSGALWWPAERTLIVADLHLEKGSALAARGGGLLPPYDTRATLTRLDALLRRYSPRRVICLGDSFHDRRAGERIDADDVAHLKRLTEATDWIWIAGNHDPELPAWIAGTVSPEVRIGSLTLRHEPQAGKHPGEVAGHLHPKSAVTVRGRRLSRRCFASDGGRIVLPAFGAYAGGLDVLDAAFGALFRFGFHAWMLGDRQVFPVPSQRLAPTGV